MDPDNSNPTTDLLNMLSKAMDSKVYGSIEVYLEEGQITQISQRVIKKIKRRNPPQLKIKKTGHVVKGSHENISLKFQN